MRMANRGAAVIKLEPGARDRSRHVSAIADSLAERGGFEPSVPVHHYFARKGAEVAVFAGPD